MNYEVFVHSDLLQGIVPRAGLQRLLIFEFLESLKRQPDQLGDFVEKDMGSVISLASCFRGGSASELRVASC